MEENINSKEMKRGLDDGKLEKVQRSIVVIRNKNVIIDADVANLFGVETRRVNEAVKNNRDKFPKDYVFELTHRELASLRSKISTANLSVRSRVLPKAFTEKFAKLPNIGNFVAINRI